MAPGQVARHESVGQVLALGPETETRALKPAIEWESSGWLVHPRGSCPACLSSTTPAAPRARFQDTPPLVPSNSMLWERQIFVTPIPDGVPSGLVAPILCGGVAVSVLKKGRAAPGEWMVISGSGGSI